MGKIIGVIAIKGGVGKSSVAANLAACLAQHYQKKVLAIDANFSAPNLGLHFGLVHPKVTLHHVLADQTDVAEAVYEYEKNLHLIPGSFLAHRISPFKLKQKIHKLANHYDFVILDSSPNMNDEILATMIASDELIVVANPDYPTMAMTMHAVKVAKERQVPIIGIVLNRVHGKSFELTLDDVEKATKTPVLAVIPEDLNIQASIAETTPAAISYQYTDAAVEIRKLAAALIGEEYRDPRLMGFFKRVFRGQIGKDEVNRALLREGKLY